MCDCDIRSCVLGLICRHAVGDMQPSVRRRNRQSCRLHFVTQRTVPFGSALSRPIIAIIVQLALVVICSRPTYAITRRAMFWRLRARERSDESPRKRMGTKNPPGIKPCQEKVSPWKEILQNLHEISQDLCPAHKQL